MLKGYCLYEGINGMEGISIDYVLCLLSDFSLIFLVLIHNHTSCFMHCKLKA